VLRRRRIFLQAVPDPKDCGERAPRVLARRRVREIHADNTAEQRFGGRARERDLASDPTAMIARIDLPRDSKIAAFPLPRFAALPEYVRDDGRATACLRRQTTGIKPIKVPPYRHPSLANVTD